MPEQNQPDERKETLFRMQKELLDTLLDRKAIDRNQYEKSLSGLREKMGIRDVR